MITSQKVIITGALTLKTAALRFCKVSEEVINAIEENSIAKSTKDFTEFSRTLLKRKIWSFH